MQNIEELKKLALQNFRIVMPRKPEDAVKLMADTFLLGVDVGVEIQKMQEVDRK